MRGLGKEQPALDEKSNQLQRRSKNQKQAAARPLKELGQHHEKRRPQKAATLGDEAQTPSVLARNPKPHLLEQKVLGAVGPLHRTNGAFAKAGRTADAG